MECLLAKTLNDASLADVPPNVGRHELELLVAKAQKSSDLLRLLLTLRDGSTIGIEALPRWSVAQLKRSIERTISANANANKTYKISWKQHWKRWALVYDGAELNDGRRELQAYGLSATGVLLFMPHHRKSVDSNAHCQRIPRVLGHGNSAY